MRDGGLLEDSPTRRGVLDMGPGRFASPSPTFWFSEAWAPRVPQGSIGARVRAPFQGIGLTHVQ